MRLPRGPSRTRRTMLVLCGLFIWLYLGITVEYLHLGMERRGSCGEEEEEENEKMEEENCGVLNAF